MNVADGTGEVTRQHVAAYRRDGFIQLQQLVTADALLRLRAAVSAAVEEELPSSAERAKAGPYSNLFIQRVNLWQRHASVREFTLSPRFANIAARLAGVPVRIWHDQALYKEPMVGTRTPWHQDAHYWPHVDPRHQITLWIALSATTTRNGCMAFVPGTQVFETLPPVNLGEPRDIFQDAPQCRGVKPTVCELDPGSCTFHNGLTFHYAGANRSTRMREAFAIIYMPADTIYTGARHVVTDPLDLQPGVPLDGESFPLVSTLAMDDD